MPCTWKIWNRKTGKEKIRTTHAPARKNPVVKTGSKATKDSTGILALAPCVMTGSKAKKDSASIFEEISEYECYQVIGELLAQIGIKF